MNEGEKYQAVRMDNTAALILDKKEGHLWLFGVHKDTGVVLIYQGQISPGEKPGDMVIENMKPEPK